MRKFWRWPSVTDQRSANSPAPVDEAHFDYRSRLNVTVNVSGDIDYVLRMLPIIRKQLEAADGRVIDAA